MLTGTRKGVMTFACLCSLQKRKGIKNRLKYVRSKLRYIRSITALHNQRWETRFLCPENVEATKFFAPHVRHAIFIDNLGVYHVPWKWLSVESLQCLALDLSHTRSINLPQKCFVNLRELRLLSQDFSGWWASDIDFVKWWPNLKHFECDTEFRFAILAVPSGLTSAMLSIDSDISLLDQFFQQNPDLIRLGIDTSVAPNQVIHYLFERGLHQTLTYLRLGYIRAYHQLISAMDGEYYLSKKLASFTNVKELCIWYEPLATDTVNICNESNVLLLQKLHKLEKLTLSVSYAQIYPSIQIFLQKFATNTPPNLRTFEFIVNDGIPTNIWQAFLKAKPSYLECLLVSDR